MKSKVMKLIAVILLCCVSFLCVGCVFGNQNAIAPGDDDVGNVGDVEKPGEDLEGVGDDAVIGMYGSKVLYRPDSYDYDEGSGGNGQKNNYYGIYAYALIDMLNKFYGITNENEGVFPVMTENDIDNNFELMKPNLLYFYDSIRYQVDTIGIVTKEKTLGSEKVTDLAQNKQYFVVGADTNTKWKWSFDYDVNGVSSPLIYEDNTLSVITTNNIYNVEYKDEDLFNIEYKNKFEESNFKNNYQKIFLGTADKENEENYSDFVKTMEYVVYSYALNLEPQTVTVTINEGDNQSFSVGEDGKVTQNLYSITIGSYESVDKALEDITDAFHIGGSHVGLMKDQIRKIANWIKVNVIGLGTNITDDSLVRYDSGVTAVYDNDGNLVDIEFPSIPTGSADVNRNYDIAVDKIVNYVCQFATIGKEENGDDVTIDDRFLASEVKEYAGDSFFIAGDENFPKPPKDGEQLSPRCMLPLEYQSVVIMLDKPTAITDFVIALKYDADLSGTQEGIYDMSKYLDVIVELNYYSHRANRLITIGSERTRVYDGPYQYGLSSKDYPEYNLPDDHGTVWFTVDEKNPEYKDLLIDTASNSGLLPIGEFNVDIGGGILKTDVGRNNYLKPLVSKEPLVLVGTTDVRKYYSIIEPDDDEIADPELTYTTGRFNPDKFSGADGCDYLEITYKVLKKKGDLNTNYKFYTGLIGVYDSNNFEKV